MAVCSQPLAWRRHSCQPCSVRTASARASLALLLACGTAVRLLAGPWGGRLADRTGRPSIVLAGFAAASALVATGYAPARGLPLLLLVSVLHACGPGAPDADRRRAGTRLRQRQAGFSIWGGCVAPDRAAFIVATLASGQLVGQAGLGIIVWLNAGLLAAAAMLSLLVPNLVTEPRPTQPLPRKPVPSRRF